MSKSAHPNIHAVKFSVDLMGLLLFEQSLPTTDTVLGVYRRCLRGKAIKGPGIEIPDLRSWVDAFLQMIAVPVAKREIPTVQELLVTFTVGLSHKVDTAVEQRDAVGR